MRLPDTAHTSQPWRIHEIAHDFRLEDVWQLATPGGRDDLPRLVQQFATSGESEELSLLARALFAIRWRLGKLFGWDEAAAGSSVPTLRDRLPDDLRALPQGPDLAGASFRSLYLTHDEWAAELANRTVHAVLHMGWVRDEAGGHRGQLAVLVRPRGLIGKAYMAAIGPPRRLVVFPAKVRGIEHTWQTSQPTRPDAPA